MGKYAQSLQALQHWFERQKRILPWRDQPTLYRVWVSEIMLQQTQVVTVVPYFERFMARFPTVESLAEAPDDDVLKAWAGLGYYSRARNLHRAAKKIAAEGFPRDRAGWLEIPGVGEYTAGAILSIALDQPEAILDGNVERVLSRVRKVDRKRGDAAYKARLWRLARAFVESAHEALSIRPSVLNQSLMELGATTCTPKRPKCPLCPLAPLCRARERGEQELYPPKKKPKEWLKVDESMVAVFDAEGRVLLRKREAGEWRAGLWDLPVSGQAPGWGDLRESRRMGAVESRHVVTRHKVTRVTEVLALPALWSAAEAGSPVKRGSASESEWRWVSIEDPGVAVGSALKRTLEKIRERFPGFLPGN